MGLHGWSPQVSAGGLCGSLRVVVGKINQSKSVPMMSLNVVGNINQSNSRHLCRSPWVCVGLHGWSLWVVSMGLCGWSLQVSMGGLHRSLQVVSVGGLCRSPWVSAGGLHRSPWVVSTGLCGSLQVVSASGLRGSLQVVYNGLCGWSLQVSMGGLFVLNYHWLPIETIDLVGDNREFEVSSIF